MTQNNNRNSNSMPTAKYKLSYYDKNGNLRYRYVPATSDRDALVDTWLNDKTVQMPVSVEKV